MPVSTHDDSPKEKYRVRNTFLRMIGLRSSRFTIGLTPTACNGTRGVFPRNIQRCPAMSCHAAGSAIAPQRRSLPLSHDREHVTFAEQHAAAGRPVTADLTGHQPSINCPYSDSAQLSDLAFRQQLLVIGVFG